MSLILHSVKRRIERDVLLVRSALGDAPIAIRDLIVAFRACVTSNQFTWLMKIARTNEPHPAVAAPFADPVAAVRRPACSEMIAGRTGSLLGEYLCAQRGARRHRPTALGCLRGTPS